MTEDELLAEVKAIKQEHIRSGMQPVYQVDSRDWVRELGDVVLWGVTHGTNTLGFRQGLRSLKEKGIIKD